MSKEFASTPEADYGGAKAVLYQVLDESSRVDPRTIGELNFRLEQLALHRGEGTYGEVLVTFDNAAAQTPTYATYNAAEPLIITAAKGLRGIPRGEKEKIVQAVSSRKDILNAQRERNRRAARIASAFVATVYYAGAGYGLFVTGKEAALANPGKEGFLGGLTLLTIGIAEGARWVYRRVGPASRHR